MSPDLSDTKVTIGTGSKISVVFLGGLLMTAVLGTATFTRKMTQIELRLERIEKSIDTTTSWTLADMVRWAAYFQRLNPALTVPDPK